MRKLKSGDPNYEPERDFLANAADFMQRFGYLTDGVMGTEHNAKDVMQSDHEAGKQGDQADEDRR